jgi:hypothetical protein
MEPLWNFVGTLESSQPLEVRKKAPMVPNSKNGTFEGSKWKDLRFQWFQASPTRSQPPKPRVRTMYATKQNPSQALQLNGFYM